MYPTDIRNRDYSTNTERARKQVINDFLQVTHVNIRDASDNDVEKWISSMEQRKLSTGTKRQRISILNQINPRIKTVLPHRQLPEKHYLDTDQLTALLFAVSNTEGGIRDLFIFALITSGLKSTQVRLLQWKHISQTGTSLHIRLSQKKVTLPSSFKALANTLIRTANGDDDYICRATTDHYKHLPHSNRKCSGGSLSAAEINRRVKKYARQAGLDEARVSARTFAYTVDQIGYAEAIRAFDSAIKRCLPQRVPWMTLTLGQKPIP